MHTNPLPNFDALWDYANPANTEATFRLLLPQAIASGNISYHLQLLTQIARAQGLQRQFTEAHLTLDGVAPLVQSEVSLAQARYFLERGRVFNSSGQPDEAVLWFTRAYQSAITQHAEYHAIDALHMLGIAAPPEERLKWNEQALDLAEKTSDLQAQNWRGALYNNIGWTYHDAGQYEQAMEMFQRAYVFQQSTGNAKEIRIARWCIGRELRSLNHCQEALELQQALYADWAASGEQQAGYVSEEIAECLNALGRQDESRPYFAEAFALLAKDPWFAAQEPERLQRIYRLGKPVM